MLGAFGEHALEAHGEYLRCYLVVVYQFGVVHHFRFYAEQRVQFVYGHTHLLRELLRVGERCQRVRIGRGEEFHGACVGEFLEQVDEFGHILFELFQRHAADAYRAAERAFALLYHAQEAFGGRDVAVVGHTAYDFVVEEVVVVVVVVADVEEAVALEAHRLMDFEVEANGFHCRMLCVACYRLRTLL